MKYFNVNRFYSTSCGVRSLREENGEKLYDTRILKHLLILVYGLWTCYVLQTLARKTLVKGN